MSFGRRRWSPSRAARKRFAEEMDAVDAFCQENGIRQSSSSDSYYFSIGEQEYRVSNHTVAASNRAAYDEVLGQTRPVYHPGGEKEGVIYITAGKTRIVQIYSDLKAGIKLNRRGERI